MMSSPKQLSKTELSNSAVLLGLLLIGGVVAYIDHLLTLHTILIEIIHASCVTAIFIFSLIAQKRNPEIKQFGWSKIVLGLFLLSIGSWIDILDDPPTLSLLQLDGTPFGRSWQQAFIKKILGYTAGIGLVAVGFFEWVPWLIQTRQNVEALNTKLGKVNQRMQRTMISLDERVEAERLHISRELHDDVAQQLTVLTMQLQMSEQQAKPLSEKLKSDLKQIRSEVSETLKSVRRISQGLRPEALEILGLIPAFEQFLDKLRGQYPHTTIQWQYTLEDEVKPLAARLNEADRHTLFRILQEGLRNTLKHSQAKQISVSIFENETLFRYCIEDNGIGLPWEQLPSNEQLVQMGHLGIVGLQERVTSLSGSFTLKNASIGAHFAIEIPKFPSEEEPNPS